MAVTVNFSRALSCNEVDGKASEFAFQTVVAIKSPTVLYTQVGDPLYWNEEVVSPVRSMKAFPGFAWF